MIDADLNYLNPYGSRADIVRLRSAIIRQNRALTDVEHLGRLRAILERPNVTAQHKEYGADAVTIGGRQEIGEEEYSLIEAQAKEFMPWRKGPFRLFGIDIDSEWRSDMKWARFEPYLGSLEGETICDLGCGNGYFMFRMAAHRPKMVLGLDPTRKFKLTFMYLNAFAGEKNLHLELLGYEHLIHLKEIFDTLFCMGILYHHPDPDLVLRNCYHSMKPDGRLFVETLGIASSEPVALFPRGRYAHMRGVWYIPSESVLESWLYRAGFDVTNKVYNEVLTSEEQRRTAWANIDSLAEFTEASGRTIEGYETPRRIYMTARKNPNRRPPA